MILSAALPNSAAWIFGSLVFEAALSIAPWKFLIWLISVKESLHLCCG